MTKDEILKLIDSCPLWDADADSVAIMKEVRQYFELKLKQEELKEHKKIISAEPNEFVTRKEFRHEIIALQNAFNEFKYQPDNHQNIEYPAHSTDETGYDQIKTPSAS